jgi:membrane associated rhomboid family serine protease
MLETVFFLLTLLVGAAEGCFFLLGYLRALKGKPSPKWFGPVKLTLFCVFFAFWFLWNWFRNLP